MNVVILTEGGRKIGFGHIARCVALYQAFKKDEGIIPELIINSDEEVKYFIKDVKYRICNWLRHQKEIAAHIEEEDIVIIDSYLAPVSFYKRICEVTKTTVCIDDNKRLVYPEGIVINGGIHARKLRYPKRRNVTYLLGTKYTPLRETFWDIPERKINKEIKSILITLGGSDIRNTTPKILKFLQDKTPQIHKRVIIGNGANNIEDIKKIRGKHILTKLIFLPDARQIAFVMRTSDVAISAGGQTLYELARIGVPTIGICLTDNQEGNLEGWQKSGFIDYIGWYNDSSLMTRFEQSLRGLVSYEERIKRSKIGRSLVDGNGAHKIIRALIN